MAKDVGRDAGRNPGLGRGPFHRALDPVFVEVMAPLLAGPRVRRYLVRAKHVLLLPLEGRLRVLPPKRIGQFDLVFALLPVRFLLIPAPVQVLQELRLERGRERNAPVPVSFSGPHRDLVAIKRQILHAQPEASRHSHSRSALEPRHQPFDAVHLIQKRLHLFSAEHNGNPLGHPGARQVPEVSRVLFQNFLEKEDDRIDGLVLSARGHLLVHRQMVEELVNLPRTHFRGPTVMMVLTKRRIQCQ